VTAAQPLPPRTPPALRDPLSRRRLAWLLAALVIAWPMLQLSGFAPSVLFAPGNLQVIGGFLAGFLPPETAPDFLAMLGKATLETLAMATAGTALAFVIGAPLAFVTTRALSVSRIGPGPGRAQAAAVRQAGRSVLMVLRAVPEIVWALVFVRALGLGPAAGVLALALTYSGLLGRV
jgi:phosphonate transport system permease protein